MRKEVKMSYLPDVYQEFEAHFPELGRAYDALAVKIHEWGPLDVKTRHLVKLGVAMGLHSEGAVRSHARRGLAEGLKPDEIYHAVLLAFTTAGFPSMIAALKWVDEVIAAYRKEPGAKKRSRTPQRRQGRAK
jgi:4-carboxymuconolactone decarboxylase